MDTLNYSIIPETIGLNIAGKTGTDYMLFVGEQYFRNTANSYRARNIPCSGLIPETQSMLTLEDAAWAQARAGDTPIYFGVLAPSAISLEVVNYQIPDYYPPIIFPPGSDYPDPWATNKIGIIVYQKVPDPRAPEIPLYVRAILSVAFDCYKDGHTALNLAESNLSASFDIGDGGDLFYDGTYVNGMGGAAQIEINCDRMRPNENWPVNTFSECFGAAPETHSLANTVKTGFAEITERKCCCD